MTGESAKSLVEVPPAHRVVTQRVGHPFCTFCHRKVKAVRLYGGEREKAGWSAAIECRGCGRRWIPDGSARHQSEAPAS